MAKIRKTNHKLNDMINVPRPSDSPYSGSDPQILPFPPELVTKIVSYVDRACDKRNARLVCKGFAAAGLSSLTSKVYFSTSLIGIDYSSKGPHFSSPTLEIAIHPVVSKYITTMVCDGAQLPRNYLVLKVFQDLWLSLGKPRTGWPIEKIHNSYISRYAQEDTITKDGEDQKIFCRALQNFPKLDCIWFKDVKKNKFQDWPRHTWPSAAPLVPQGDLWGSSSPYHNFAMCIRVLGRLGTNLRELHIVGSDYAISHGIFTRASSTDYHYLIRVFENLRKVELNVNTHHDTYPLTYSGLGRILTNATELQSLDLKCHGKVRCQSRLVLSQLFRDFTWLHLKHIGLSGFRLHSDVGLIAFFQRHHSTIDSVRLEFMFLHQEDINSPIGKPCEAWTHFFAELRRLSIKFDDLHLYGIHDCSNTEYDVLKLDAKAGYGEKVLRYLNHGGPNPLEHVPDVRG